METETLETQPFPPAGEVPPPPNAGSPPGFKPTPDPTRSGALWVGGAGVSLLLAAAAVLTAVRWDDIGQSVKLGGLVAITLALLAAGQKFKETIPMTAQAIFHLGALLIPFDMAAVAILAGRPWQQTLLLTSVTSVIAWYGIERAVPSRVLLWSAHFAMIGLAAGVAAVSSVGMPLALAVISAAALPMRQAVPAGVWAGVAGVLPIASFVPWPTRIAGAMADLGFDSLDRWQPLAAGVIATITLIGVARLMPRLEVAWSAVAVAAVTALVALTGFADAQVSFFSLAVLFVSLELLALATVRDALWQPITNTLAWVGEMVAVATTTLLLLASLIENEFEFVVSPASFSIAAGLLALGWLTADRRRLDDSTDWMTGLVLGSDWPLTTVMFPVAVMAVVLSLAAPAVAVSLTATALAYWMVATWRTNATYGAIVLALVAVVAAAVASHWAEFALGYSATAVLMLAAQLRVRAQDMLGSASAAAAGAVTLLVTSQSAIAATKTGWPVILVLIAAWTGSWIIEARGADRTAVIVDWAGRSVAGVVFVSSLWMYPARVGLVMCGTVMALAAADYLLARHRGAKEGHSLLATYSVIIGAAFALAAVPGAALVGILPATAGAMMTVAGFVVVGIALALPRPFELPLGVAAVVGTGVGILMASGEAGAFAVSLMAAGCTTMFVGAALRELTFGVSGYATLGVGVVLQLAVWDVTWLEPYLVLPGLAAIAVGHRYHRLGGSSWAAYAPTIALMAYVSLADRFAGGSAWHAVIAGTVGVVAVIGGGYRKLVGPLITGSAVLAVVVGYESLGPAALVPTWAWLAAGGTILLAAGVVMERSDTTPLERGQQIRTVLATQFS